MLYYVYLALRMLLEDPPPKSDSSMVDVEFTARYLGVLCLLPTLSISS